MKLILFTNLQHKNCWNGGVGKGGENGMVIFLTMFADVIEFI